MTEAIIILISAALFIGIYFAPAIVARYKKKRNYSAILALNLLTGWTLIGWIISLVWALCEDRGRLLE